MAPSAREQIERINTLSAIARTSWLAMLGYFGFVGVTLLSVRDHDFFMTARQTKLPLVDVSIPTFSFFAFAPVLGAALYIYLHLHLLKLWDALAATWPRVEDEPVGERLHPWIANDFALARKGRQALRPRPLRWVGHVATWALVWLLGPFVLAGFWWRSMPAHSELLTLALGAALLASLYAGWVSWRAARDWLPERSDRPGPWRRWWRPPLAALVAPAAGGAGGGAGGDGRLGADGRRRGMVVRPGGGSGELGVVGGSGEARHDGVPAAMLSRGVRAREYRRGAGCRLR